jgi:hypothetical protein
MSVVLGQNLALPNPNATSGGGSNGQTAQPVYGNFNNSNSFAVNMPVTISLDGLKHYLDSNRPLNNATCEVTITGPNNYKRVIRANVVNGVCTANLDGANAPTQPGNYQVTVKFEGPMGELVTKPQTYVFVGGTGGGGIVVNQSTNNGKGNETVRSGAFQIAAGVLTLGAVAAAAYFVMKKKGINIKLR